MSSNTETITETNESVVDFVTSMQDRIIELHREAAGRASDLVPSTPWPYGAVDVRGAAEQAYDLQAQLLEANKRFTLELFDAWAPVVTETPVKTARTAKKAAK